MRAQAVAKRGFTLIEMMVSLAVFAVVSAVLMEMMVRQSRTYTVVEDVAEAQGKARAVASQFRPTGTQQHASRQVFPKRRRPARQPVTAAMQAFTRQVD